MKILAACRGCSRGGFEQKRKVYFENVTLNVAERISCQDVSLTRASLKPKFEKNVVSHSDTKQRAIRLVLSQASESKSDHLILTDRWLTESPTRFCPTSSKHFLWAPNQMDASDNPRDLRNHPSAQITHTEVSLVSCFRQLFHKDAKKSEHFQLG